MLDTSSRLLRLLSVLQSRSFWAGTELADHLEITGRTLRRDIDRLRSLGYVIESTSGPGGGYVLGKGTRLPPLMLDDDEAVAIAVALRSAADSFSNLGEASLGVLTKLEQILPTRLRKRVGALQAVTISVGRGQEPALDAGLLTMLAAACRDREVVELRYESRAGEHTSRAVEPLRIAHAGARRWYLVAWDRSREDFRTFRVDRIARAKPTGGTFTPRALPVAADKYVSEALALAPYSVRASVKLRGTLQALSSRIPMWCGVLEPLDARHCVLRVGADSIEGLACQLILMGSEFELLEPRALRPKLKAVVKRLQQSVARDARV